MKYRVGDIVKVRLAPLNCVMAWRTMVGHTGFIEELHAGGDRALVRTITIEGRHHGLAFMTTKALEPVNDPVWTKAMADYRRQQQQAEYEDFCRRLERQQQIEMIADKYQITVDAALEIATVVTGEDVRRIYY